MDTSNPVVNGDRRTFEEVAAMASRRARQNLALLESQITLSERKNLYDGWERLEDKDVLKQIVNTFVQNNKPPELKNSSAVLDLSKVCDKSDRLMPVCALVNQYGIPIHPPGKNQEKGHVTTQRIYGGARLNKSILYPIAQVMGQNLADFKLSKVYTYGTPEGFTTRIIKQMGRKCVSMSQQMREMVGVSSVKVGCQVLDQLFPLKAPDSDAPRLDGDLYELLRKVDITFSASAGPPYWRSKLEAFEDIVKVGIPKVCDALKTPGGYEKLYKEQPEMMLCELKNKLDRYDIDKVHTKTRPYVCAPAHWSLLFSVLCQRFCKRMFTFDENPQSASAYGFSGANGGYDKMLMWMLSPKEGEIKFIAYGDDTRLVRCHNGRFYTCNPDFVQMDGSVDFATIQLTIMWMVNHLLKSEENCMAEHFWRKVGEVWAHLATQPNFVVSGTGVYRKKSKDGLMSGITGTTLFDTVKACVSWRQAIDSGVVNFWSEESVSKFMLEKCGLEIKKGTFEWEEIKTPMGAFDGELLVEAKFLGVQMAKYKNRFGDGYTVAPTIPFNEMLELLLVPKDDPAQATPTSTISNQRLLFDRLRGYTITCGFTNPDFMHIVNHLVDSIPPSAILMNVQIEGGMKPEHITLQDVGFPDSAGFPSQLFCYLLYKGAPEEVRKAAFLDLFPTFDRSYYQVEAKEIKYQVVPQPYPIEGKEYLNRPRDPVSHPAVVSEVLQVLEDPTFICEDLVDVAPIADREPSFKRDPLPLDKIPPRSKIEGTSKRLPTRVESLRLYLSGIGGVAQLATAAAVLGMSEPALLNLVRDPKTPFYTNTVEGFELISETPFMQASRTEMVEKAVERHETDGQVLRIASTPLLDRGAINKRLELFGVSERVENKAVPLCMALFQLNGCVPVFKTVEVDVTNPLPVMVELWVSPHEDATIMERIGIARGLSKSAARDVLAAAVMSCIPDMFPADEWTPRLGVYFFGKKTNVEYSATNADTRALQGAQEWEQELPTARDPIPVDTPVVVPVIDVSVRAMVLRAFSRLEMVMPTHIRQHPRQVRDYLASLFPQCDNEDDMLEHALVRYAAVIACELGRSSAKPQPTASAVMSRVRAPVQKEVRPIAPPNIPEEKNPSPLTRKFRAEAERRGCTISQVRREYYAERRRRNPQLKTRSQKEREREKKRAEELGVSVSAYRRRRAQNKEPQNASQTPHFKQSHNE